MSQALDCSPARRCTFPPPFTVRIARGLRPLDAEQMAALRARAEPLKGPWLEDWKRGVEPVVGLRGATPYKGG